MANIQKLLSKGISYWQKNDLIQAKNIFKKIILDKPNNFEAKSYIGVIDLQLGNFEEGIELLKSALLLSPNDDNLKKNLNNGLIDYSGALISEEKYKQAFKSLKEAILIYPDNPNAYLNYFKLSINTREFIGLDKIYELAKNNHPLIPEIHFYYANALFDQKKYIEAISIYDQALSQKKDFVECIFHQALCLDSLNRKEEASKKYDLAISLRPDYSLAKFNLALLNLSINNFCDGWKIYKERWGTNKFLNKFLKTSNPLLTDDLKKDEKIYIWAEQGIGDQILYLSMLNDFSSLNDNLIVSVDKRLIPICERSFKKINFISQDESLDDSMFDKHIPMGDLGLFVRKTIEDFKNQKKQFLNPDLYKLDKFKKNLRKEKKFVCGLSWTSKGAHSHSKSINLKNFEKIFKKFKYKFVNLEYVDNSDEIEEIGKQINMDFDQANEIDKFNDLDSLVSLIASCDLIITISNVTAHFAGALGIKTYLLVPFGAGRIWYWSDSEFSKWYPSINIIKQEDSHSWDSVFAKLESKLV